MSLIVPVEIQNVPPHKILVAPARRELQVTIRGPSFLVGPIASAPPIARVRVPETISRRFKAGFSTADLALPSGVEVLSIDPSEVELLFDDLVTKEVRVEVPRIGRVREDLRLNGIDITPLSISLTGPSTELRDVDSVETTPIDLRDISDSRTIEVMARIPGNLTTTPSRRISARIKISPQMKERRIEGRPVEVRSEPGIPAPDVTPRVVTITVSGAASALDSLDAASVVPYVRPTGETPGMDTGVLVDLLVGVSLVKVDPPTVRTIRPGEAPPQKKRGASK